MALPESKNVEQNFKPVLPGFKHINRYWDKVNHVVAAKLLPGELYVTTQREAIVTVLGSCVSACIRDPKFGIGGMNHFMLPIGEEGGGSNNSWNTAATRYGNFAMDAGKFNQVGDQFACHQAFAVI